MVNPLLHNNPFWHLSKYHVGLFENIMENGAFAQKSKCSIFHNIFKSIQNLTLFFSWIFSMLSKNRKQCHDLKIAYVV